MALSYSESLEAAIQYLQQLKGRGVNYVSVASTTLSALSDSAANVRTAKAPPVPPNQSAPISRPPPQPLPDLAKSKEAQGTIAAAPLLSVAPVNSEAKEAAIAELRMRVLQCQKCPHLVKSRKTVVFGVGDIHSPLMFIGEAPGADEDLQGEPFVGRAGQLLTRIIQTMGFSRESVYIANVLKCRPDTPGQSAGNRKPTTDEMKTCLPYLLAQIDLIQPKVIVALGATAMEGIFGRTVAITKERGNFQRFREVPVMPTYHPSYLLRNQAPTVKREVWEDMLAVLEKLGRPISEKQRNYFKAS